MSYKSLLFCADEKAARLVTQVLSELDFTVELAAETYPTVKKLTDEHFDALVVDCQNEQDASLLFKAARNSSENHSSLSVAVVEGQAGVAKAFRIGANLVLTKPINVEQSKSTLRVARGLLKKTQAKPADFSGPVPTAPAVLTSPADSLIPSSQATTVPAKSSFSAPAMSAGNSVQNSPFSVLEVEKESSPATEASDAAALESLPHLPVAKSAGPVSISSSPAFAGSSSAAAAAAPALEKKPVELHAAGAALLFTNEPIVKDPHSPEVFESPAVPTFSSLDTAAAGEGKSSGSLKVGLALLALAVLFYFGWQKLPGLLHRAPATAASTTAEQSSPQLSPSLSQSPSAPPANSGTQPLPSVPAQTPPVINSAPAKEAPEELTANNTTQSAAEPENIELREMPFSRDAKVTVAPKPQPLIVKAGNSKLKSQSATQPTAPTLNLETSGANSTISTLVTTTAALPVPAPGTTRISQGVSQGLLTKKVAPVYPSMAMDLHKEGVVELLATVSKQGTITSVKVLSGDSMLASAAKDAVRKWQYRPYLLNGQPLEVETQISISFKLPK